MRYKRMELLLIVLTVLALGAGVAAGLLAARLPAANTNPITPQSADITPLVAELQLTPAQRDQMRTIWSASAGIFTIPSTAPSGSRNNAMKRSSPS